MAHNLPEDIALTMMKAKRISCFKTINWMLTMAMAKQNWVPIRVINQPNGENTVDEAKAKVKA